MSVLYVVMRTLAVEGSKEEIVAATGIKKDAELHLEDLENYGFYSRIAIFKEVIPNPFPKEKTMTYQDDPIPENGNANTDDEELENDDPVVDDDVELENEVVEEEDEEETELEDDDA